MKAEINTFRGNIRCSGIVWLISIFFFVTIFTSACGKQPSSQNAVVTQVIDYVTPVNITTLTLHPRINLVGPGNKKPEATIMAELTTAKPTIIPASALTETRASTSTPAIDFNEFVWKFNIYTNEEYGFQFEYPAILDEPEYSNCRPRETESTDHRFITNFRLGARIDLLIQEADNRDLATVVDDQLKEFSSGEDFNLSNRSASIIDGEKATTFDYRFGMSNRFGTATYIEHQNYIYIFNLTAGAVCRIDDLMLTDWSFYDIMLKTFKFIH
jgi:hypothetical protein